MLASFLRAGARRGHPQVAPFGHAAQVAALQATKAQVGGELAPQMVPSGPLLERQGPQEGEGKFRNAERKKFIQFPPCLTYSSSDSAVVLTRRNGPCKHGARPFWEKP